MSGVEISECPYCGGGAYVPDGLYGAVDGAIALLSAPESTVQTLQRLLRLVSDAREKAQDTEEVASAIREQTPGLSKLIDSLPTTRPELYAFLALIVTTLNLLLSHPWKKDEPKPSITINNVFEAVVRDAKPHRRPEPRVGRNDPCPCGNGKKYKKCHGAPNREH